MLGTFQHSGQPEGIIFDGTYIWVSDFKNYTVTRVGLDGKEAGTFKVGLSPELMAFDGANVWVAVYGANRVSKL